MNPFSFFKCITKCLAMLLFIAQSIYQPPIIYQVSMTVGSILYSMGLSATRYKIIFLTVKALQ